MEKSHMGLGRMMPPCPALWLADATSAGSFATLWALLVRLLGGLSCNETRLHFVVSTLEPLTALA